MRRAAVAELEPGMVLSRAVFNDRGELLLNAHVELTDRYIALLKERGFFSVFIEDEATADVAIGDVISQRVRETVTADLCRVYEAMERATATLRGATPLTLEYELQSGEAGRAVREHVAYHDLQRDIEEVVEDVLAADVLTGINTIRTYDSYEFIHALDSTAVAVMIGRRLHYKRTDLGRLASGALLHDIGMVLVERSTLHKRVRLSAEEAERVRQHPQLGYEMLRKLRPNEVIANHVAYQHHERQDGTGYPRGLHGTNRIHRDGGSAGRIILDAEVVAVADVYDALGSERPYRPAYPPDQIVRVLRRLSGKHLNREIVSQLIAVLPIYPLGADVQVMGGAYASYRGVVTRVHREQMDRPTIRLLLDSDRQAIRPIEIDLRRTDDVIACLPPPGEGALPAL